MLKNNLWALLLSSFMSISVAQAEEVTAKLGDTTLRADYVLADGKSEQDGVVLMLHGTLAHNEMEIMATTSELLNDEGYNTLMVNLSFGIDQRESAMLDCAIDHRHQHADAIKELGAWLDWLKQKGVNKVAVWGHSRGGGQAAWFVSEQNDNEMVEKFIAVAPATWSEEKASQSYEKRYGTALADVLAKAQALVQQGKGDELMELPGFVYCEKAKASAEAVVGYYSPDERRDTPTVLAKISKPTLVVIGSEDKVVADLPKRLEGFSQDNVQLLTVDGADHFFRDLYADEMVEGIVEFLAWE